MWSNGPSLGPSPVGGCSVTGPSAKITISSGIRRVNVPRSTSLGAIRDGRDEAANVPRPDRMQPELELGDDAEVAAAAAQRPEQLRVAVRAGLYDVAVGGDDR